MGHCGARSRLREATESVAFRREPPGCREAGPNHGKPFARRPSGGGPRLSTGVTREADPYRSREPRRRSTGRCVAAPIRIRRHACCYHPGHFTETRSARRPCGWLRCPHDETRNLPRFLFHGDGSQSQREYARKPSRRIGRLCQCPSLLRGLGLDMRPACSVADGGGI